MTIEEAIKKTREEMFSISLDARNNNEERDVTIDKEMKVVEKNYKEVESKIDLNTFYIFLTLESLNEYIDKLHEYSKKNMIYRYIGIFKPFKSKGIGVSFYDRLLMIDLFSKTKKRPCFYYVNNEKFDFSLNENSILKFKWFFGLKILKTKKQ